MLARGKSDSAARLQRAKSTSSVLQRSNTTKSASCLPPVSDNVKPDTHNSHHTQRLQALTAAHIAFDRSHGPKVASDRKSAISAPAVASRRKGNEGTHFARSREYRKSGTTRKSVAGSSEHRLSERDRSVLEATPKSQNSSSGILSSSRSFDIRKVLSSGPALFSDLGTGSQHGSESGTTGFRTGTGSDATNHSPLAQKLAKPRIYSKRASPTGMENIYPAARENQSDEEIIALARDRYLQDYQSQRLRQSKSFMSSGFIKSLSKSRRSSQMNESPIANDFAAVDNVQGKKGDSIHTDSSTKPPSISASLKSRVKRVLNRSSKSISEMPPQQVQANEQHYSRVPSAAHRTERSSSTVIHGDSVSLSHPNTPVQSTVGTHNSSGDGGIFQVPMFDESRVTSWADTSTQHTIVMPDIDLMPAIDEDMEPKTHQSAHRSIGSSSHRKRLSIPKRKSSNTFHEKSPVDGKRLLSALVKQIRSSSLGKSSTIKEVNSKPWSEHLLEGDESCDSNASPEKPRMIPTIRNVQEEMPFQVPETLNDIGNLPAASQSKSSVMSPSIYTLRNESQMMSPVGRAMPLNAVGHGTAYITESHPISKWQLPRSTEELEKRSLISSGEWRAWVTDELADFGKDTSTPARADEHLQGKTLGHRRESAQINEATPASALAEQCALATYRAPSDIFGVNSDIVSAMNERFPMLAISRRTSARNTIDAGSLSRGPVNSQSKAVELKQPADKGCFEPQKSEIDVVLPDSASSASLERSADRDQERIVTTLSAIGAKKPPMDELAPKRRRSSHALRPRRTNNSEAAHRQLTRQASNLDENFLLRIRRGPYEPEMPSPERSLTTSAMSLVPSARVPAKFSQNKENTPPTKGQRLADEFLNNRLSSSGGRQSRAEERADSSPAFL